MRERLESRKLAMIKYSMHHVISSESAKERDEELNVQVRSLLVAGAALSVARRRLQVMEISHKYHLIHIIFAKKEKKKKGSFYLKVNRQVE